LAPKPQQRKKEQPDEEVFTDYGPWGDLWRYFKLAFSLALNFGFAVFVGYVLGEMADDTFLGAYDAVFTHIGLGLGFLGALAGTRKRVLRFAGRQQDLLERRHGAQAADRSSPTSIALGCLALFAGLCRASGLIFLPELERSGALAYLWADIVVVGGGLLAMGLFILLRRPPEVKDFWWLFLVPIAAGGLHFFLSLAGGAKPGAAVTWMLMALAPLVGMYIGLFDGKRERGSAAE